MLETVYYIGQTIAVIAILCSLGAIWWQQRETNKIARADMTERVLGKYSEAMRVMTEDPDLAGHYSNLVRGNPPKNTAVEQRLVWFFSMMMQAHATSFMLWRDKLTDERSISPHNRTMTLHLRVPLFRQEWERTKRRRTFAEDHVEYVDRLIAADEAARQDKDQSTESAPAS
ncbi:MAG: hypothetical protein GYB42_11360 [Alphaproteobacteria bacterium]|nr:hypothetical protein [Alphaproteobacteria bacterium]